MVFGKIVDDIGRAWMNKSKYTKRTGFYAMGE